MDDLDALLDDLHATSQQYRSPQHQQDQYHVEQHYHNDQPLYEPTNILNTTAVIETTVYKTPNSTQRSVSQSERFQTPPTRTASQSERYNRSSPTYQNERVSQSSDVELRHDGSLGRQGHDSLGRASLRSNLSELDNMLEDLNSAHFLSEVDKKSKEVHSPYANIPEKPEPREENRQGTSLVQVDRMLGDLEREADRNRENARMGMRYEKKTVTTTSYGNGHMGSGEHINHNVHDGHEQTSSNATRELDDLMASLSEFNMKPMPADGSQVHVQQQHQVHQQARLPGTPPMIRVNEPPYATVGTKVTRTTVTTQHIDGGRPQQQMVGGGGQHVEARSQQMNSAGPHMTDSRSLSRDGSVTRFDTPVRNLVPDIVQVQDSSYANVTVNKQTTQQTNGGHSGGFSSEHHQYANNNTVRTDQPDCRKDKLDAMLGQLDTDMQRHGVTTVQKGHCAACNKPIVGQVITALGKIWHPEHFCCAHCQNELGTMTFFERDGKPYCEEDYHALFSPRCAGCNGPILDRCVTGLGQTWHPEHFCCAHCGRPFDDEGFHEKEGKPYCREDYFEMFAPKCGGCLQAIIDNYISALNKQWHPECFICQDCHMPFSGGSFFEHDGLPFCETHYHAKRGSLCAGCQKPITGRCITAMYKKFHPEHFVCAFCLKQLNKGTFKEQNDKPYCHGCFCKLFG